MTQTEVRGHKFERFLLGMGMSVVLLILERRVKKMVRDSAPRDGRTT
jgi:hypothetical protein